MNSRDMNNKHRWLEETYKRTGERPGRFSTVSDMEIDPVYGPEDVTTDFQRDIGYPGEYPYTRGVYGSMYRGRLWTMRQFAGFGLAEDTNARFHFLLGQGQDGLSTAFDMPTLMGYDADHERAMGEVGREGVSVTSIHDMARLFDRIPMDKVTTSMTVNCSASILLAMYLVNAERQGVPWERVGGTIQNDMLKEFIAQKEWICPPKPAVRIVTDMIEFCARKAPRWHPVSISGYHIREAGSTAVQELAFTLADGICYVEEGLKRGLNIDDFAPQLSFFFNLHNDFLEEVAKLRAARRIWARLMKERFHAQSERSMLLRTHAQTAGRLADRPAAAQQYRPRRAAGAGRSDGRGAVAAHQFDGRDAGVADRGRGDGGVADAADYRRRKRGGEYRRSVWRQLRDRGAHRSDGTRGDGLHPQDR